MKRIENCPTEALWNIGALAASGDVADDRDSFREERDTLEAEGRILAQLG